MTTIYTIGHSNHDFATFVELLRQHQIGALVDIRRFASSRTCPQFNHDHLAQALPSHGIAYHWIEALGGRRSKLKGVTSPNGGLRNQSFRNYADYMLTEGFRDGINALLKIAESQTAAIMCAENVFWRCHRRLVSDYLTARGVAVEHIFPGGESKPHVLTDSAQVENRSVTYPGQKTLFDELS